MRLHTNTAELADDHDVLNAAGWPISRIRRELTDEQIEEMIDTYLARSDDAVAGALATILEEGAGPWGASGRMRSAPALWER